MRNTMTMACAIMTLAVAITAVSLGRSAGILYNAGSNPAATQTFAAAIFLCLVAGAFAFVGLRVWRKDLPAEPQAPAKPERPRKWCFTEW